MNQQPPGQETSHFDWLDPYDPLCKQAHRIIDELQDWYGIEEILVKLDGIIGGIGLEVSRLRQELQKIDAFNADSLDIHYAINRAIDHAKGIHR